MPSKALQFGVFAANPVTGELTKRGIRVKLPDQSFQMLYYLLERPGEIVTREEVRAKLWPDTTVDFDTALNTAIRKIRRALADSADTPRYIETIPKRGYRFLAAVEEVAEQGPPEAAFAPRPAPFWRRYKLWLVGGLGILLLGGAVAAFRILRPRSGAASVSVPSIAVLPFVNATQDSSLDFLTDGIAESVIQDLVELGSLRVMAPGTTLNYKGRTVDPRTVGRELKVAAVLEGRVEKRGDVLNIQADMVNTGDGSELWAARYRRPIAESLDVEREISRELVRRLRGVPEGWNAARLIHRTTSHPDAYQHYLSGLYNMRQLSSESAREAVKEFNQAIAIDPEYELPWVGLGWAYQVMDDWVFPPLEVMPKARAALQKALDLDPNESEAHATIAQLEFWFDFDQPAAGRDFQRAIELNPSNDDAHDFYGWYLVAHKRFDEGIAEHRRAIELSPLDPTHHVLLAQSFYYARRYEEAIQELLAILSQVPGYWLAHDLLGWCYEQKGDLTGAIAEFKHAAEAERLIPEPLAAMGRAYALQGKRAEAMGLRTQMTQLATRQRVSPYFFAIVDASLGDRERALADIEKAYQQRSYYLTFLGIDPKLDSIRTQPTIRRILEDVGLP